MVRGLFEIGRPRSRGWKNFGRKWTRGVRGLKNWTTFMNVKCVSSLISFKVARVVNLKLVFTD